MKCGSDDRSDGEFQDACEEEMGLGYRTSVVEQKNYIVLEAVISS